MSVRVRPWAQNLQNITFCGIIKVVLLVSVQIQEVTRACTHPSGARRAHQRSDEIHRKDESGAGEGRFFG